MISLTANVQKIWPAVQSVRYRALTSLERIFTDALVSEKFTYRKALAASFFSLIYFVLSIEFIFIYVGTFVILLTTGVLHVSVFEFGLYGVAFWSIMIVLAFFYYALATIISTPIHYIARWSMSWIALIISVMVSIAVTFTGDFVWAQLGGVHPFEMLNLFLIILGLFGCAQMFLTIVHVDAISFERFSTRWRRNDIEIYIPTRLRGKLLAVSASDHSVVILTTRGTHKLRMAFSEMLQILKNYDGYKVHRSHWVAKDAVRKIESVGGRSFIVLENGAKIPASPDQANKLSTVFKQNSNLETQLHVRK